MALLALQGVAVHASSDPPGDNHPYLAPSESYYARIYFSCIDFDPDDGVMQCGRATTSEDFGDCYYMNLDQDGAPVGMRHMRICRDISFLDSRDPVGIDELYKLHANDFDTATLTAASPNKLLALDFNGGEPVIRMYTPGQTRKVAVNWGGWVLSPENFPNPGLDGTTLAIAGRMCKGAWNDNLEELLAGAMYLDCNDAAKPRRGDFGLMVIDLENKSVTTKLLGDARGILFGDITSSPIIVDDSIFLGWVKDDAGTNPLAISSYQPKTDRYCEWTIDQPDAINPPVDIDMIRIGDKLPATYSRDGVVSILSIDIDRWNTSCGRKEIDVHQIPRIRLG